MPRYWGNHAHYWVGDLPISNGRNISQTLGATNMIKTDIVTGPAFLASALVTGDTSGLDDEGMVAYYRFLAHIEPWTVVSTVDDQEPRFTWSFRLYGGDAEGGDVIDYIVHRK
jgi:hypothetical protein